ncbi:MAG: tetratricopeptide repeat protein, partial [Desulfomonilaceae bacterium]
MKINVIHSCMTEFTEKELLSHIKNRIAHFSRFSAQPVVILLMVVLMTARIQAAQTVDPILKRVMGITDPAKKIQLLDEALQTEGLSEQTIASLYFERGVAFSQTGDCFRALEDLDAAMSHSKRMSRALLEKAECLIRVDQLDQASLALERFLLLRPGTARAYTLMGTIYEKQGALLRAEDEYSRAIRYDASYLPAMDARARIFLKEGKPRKALEDLNTMVNFAPKDPDVLTFRGSVYSKLRDYKSALADYAKAEALKPNDEKIIKDRVLTFLKIGKPSKALEILSQHSPDPDDVESRLFSARAYMLSNNFEKAISLLNEIQKKWPNNAQCRLLYGSINYRKGNIDAALANLNAALELD